ncbi:MAG: NAD(P)-dependent oxidoreductase [Alcaligenaceae bacterium]|nr:NAD(P)-dependent oxidoreductase [Alcaligenaceae bacterium]
MKIAFIGCGEVGLAYINAFKHTSHQITYLCARNHPASLQQLARELNASLETKPGDWLGEADVVVSAVFGHGALDMFTQAQPWLRPGALYIDMTTADPEHMVQAAQLAARHDIHFTDVAVMGAVGLLKHKTTLICAGTGAAQTVELFETIQTPISIKGNRAGDAATLKLLRSVFTKGLEALAVECLVAAEKKDLRPTLYEVLSDIDATPLSTFLETLVITHTTHAPRRLKEVTEAKRQLTLNNIEPLVSTGVESLFARTSQALEHSLPGEEKTIESSLTWLAGVAEVRKP